jgi:hypothetical protein
MRGSGGHLFYTCIEMHACICRAEAADMPTSMQQYNGFPQHLHLLSFKCLRFIVDDDYNTKVSFYLNL